MMQLLQVLQGALCEVQRNDAGQWLRGCTLTTFET